MQTNTNVQSIQAQIIERQKAQLESRVIALLQTSAGEADFLKSSDMKTLRVLADKIEKAYDKPLAVGFQFSEPIELIVAIARALQYAKREIREMLTPTDANDLNLFALFDRDLRDAIISSYGSLPYLREATQLAMPDGSFKILDQDIVDEARKGKPCDVEALNFAIEKVAIRLGLLGNYTATQAKADEAFSNAQRQVARLTSLAEYKSQLI